MSLPTRQVCIAKQFTRSLTKANSKKLPVQLLQDYPPHGVKGQIIEVAPAFMRNVLHVDNKACYITKEHGPRIPVFTPPKVTTPAPAKTKKAPAPKSGKVDATPALSLDELSSLFSNMKSGSKLRRGLPQAAAKATPDSLPESLLYSFDDIPKPATLAALSTFLSEATKVEFLEDGLGIEDSEGAILSEVSKPGRYTCDIKVADGKPIKRKLVLY